MARAVRSVRQEQRGLTRELRAETRTWPEVATVFCARYGVNMRAALRMVRDWSQRDAAEEWNRRWPAEPKTFKNFSYWELWPAATGHAPSLDVLARLAELYECSVADLVSDCADFRPHDLVSHDRNRVAGVLNHEPGSPLSFRPDHLNLAQLAEQLDVTSIDELVRLVTTAGKTGANGLNYRALLLKTSTALSLAAADPVFADDGEGEEAMTARVDGDLGGIWQSSYVYPSTGRGQDLTGEHYVSLRHNGNRLSGESVRSSNGSHLRLDLTIDGSVATGTWSERTSPTGYYRGSVYHGALQLVLDPMRKTMRGMWVGFNRESGVSSNKWELRWVQEATRSALREYSNKV